MILASSVEDKYIYWADACEFVESLADQSVDLFFADIPYYGIVKDSWDNQWADQKDYVAWAFRLFEIARSRVKPNGSLIFMGGVGKHGCHPLYDIMYEIENCGIPDLQSIDESLWYYRDTVTWKKKRAIGKDDRYLFTREEILWYSASNDEWTFNVPYLDEKRGYAGFNAKYPARSEYKRVSNVWNDIDPVWDDITEIFRTERNTQKPLKLMDRIIQAHTNPGDVVCDPVSGWGTTGVSAIKLGRAFIGCEAIEQDAYAANERCLQAAAGLL